jgi:drug/metabolite transporter (DMT)-like permease
MKNIPTGPLLIFAAAVLWGLDGILRRSLYDLPPISIVFFEHLIGLIIIAPFLYKAWKKENALSTREWGVLGLIALFSGVLGTLFFTAALLKVNFIPFSVVFLLQKLQPLFAILMAWVVLRERIPWRYVPWACLALGAGYFVTFPNGIVNLGEGGGYVVAALFALLAAVLWGSSTALSRFMLLRRSNTFVTGMRFLLTVPIAFLFVLGLGALPSLPQVTVGQAGTLTLIAVSTGMAALWIYYRGLATTRVSVSAIVELAFPLTAVFIDLFLYHTALLPSQYAAALVMLFAMYRIALLNRDMTKNVAESMPESMAGSTSGDR